MRTSLIAVAAASVALGGCVSWGGVAVPKDSESYIATAAAGDLFEIQSAELAVAQAQREDVRLYAQHVIEEHSRNTQHLADAALEAGVSPPSSGMTSAQQRLLGQLQNTPASSFDEVFIEQQIPAHEEAIRLHHAYALTGDAEPLRRVAAMANARVKQHLSDAERIRREAGFDES